MSGGDPEFSRAFVAAYERMSEWRRDQFDASMRDAVEVIRRLCAWVERWEARGVEDAEQYANGKKR